MRVIICGGRDYNDYDYMCLKLKAFPIEYIIAGGARGADTLAIRYAKENSIPYHVENAAWDVHGKAAGYYRNKVMADMLWHMGSAAKNEIAVIAFPGGKGTKMMCDIAVGSDIPLFTL